MAHTERQKRIQRTFIGVFAAVLLVGISIGIIVWVSKTKPKQTKHDDKTCPVLPKRDNDVVKALLEKRKSTNDPSDVTFERKSKKKEWQWFVDEHYDWWMFPWKAAKGDSLDGKEWSILEGDVVDLLNTNGFIEKYVKGAEILIEAFVATNKKEKLNPVSGSNVSGARYPKIFCSFQYFKDGAKYIKDQGKVEKLDKIIKKLVKNFGQPNLKGGTCGVHVWNVK